MRISLYRIEASFNKILETKPTAFNEFKLAINSLLEFASTNTLSKNENLVRDHHNISFKCKIKNHRMYPVVL